MPVKRKTSPLVWILVIILGLFVLGAIGVVGVGMFVDFAIILQKPLPKIFWPYVAFAVIMNLLYVAFSIYACVLAAKGRVHYFLVFGRWAYAKYYGPNAVPLDGQADRPNLPPSGY